MSTIITTFPFESLYDIMGFLYSNSTIGTWQAQIARLMAVKGMTMDLTTKVYDANGQVNFLTLDNIKPLIVNFLENNTYMQVNMELKLLYPNGARHVMDPTDAYESFWLNIYSQATTNTHFASISYLETTKELSVAPIVSWTVHVHSLYNEYQNSKN